MAFKFNKDLKFIVHPYMFVLKEGQKIQKDFLDYTLMMLQVGSPETIKSPPSHSPKPKLLSNYTGATHLAINDLVC